MKNANEYVDEIGNLFDDDMHGFRSEVYRIVSAIRAEALKDAADRAVDFVCKHGVVYLLQHPNEFESAILAGEVKE